MMSENQKPGLFEEIQSAVHPLTENGKFQLDLISYGSSSGYIDIFLTSDLIDIRLITNLKYRPETTMCYFVLYNQGKNVTAGLFPTREIKIRVEKPRQKVSSRYDDLKKSAGNYTTLFQNILEKTEYIPTISRICKEISYNLQKNNLQKKPWLFLLENDDGMIRIREE